ncbi:cytochrome P450 [Nocardia jinanensis]|uniref:Cytochrome P450 n=1 Tax=Nocardia jinanensis TaxID=382504 RepID=A0A917R593_9NOCA|nr:cytochrome P450 [Nocardia jinanensis]GGK91265.1 cytochrome P450 [Nocardia jinanensis]
MTGPIRLQQANRRGRHAAADSSGSRIPIYTTEFAADPHGFYQRMRARYGALAPVDLAPGVPATLVLGYRTAVRILSDPMHFPADPRAWQQKAPVGLPIVAMMRYRPNTLRTNDSEHERYRSVTVAALAGVDLNSLRSAISRAAVDLINEFCADGEADLIERYITPLVFRVLGELTGCPRTLADRLIPALTAIFDMRNDEDAVTSAETALAELVAAERAESGDNITSRLIENPAQLSDDELVDQLLAVYQAGIEPARDLIANTLLLILTDPRFTTNQVGFAPPTRAALEEVLATDPPLAHHSIVYPPLPVLIEDVWLPADQPVLVSPAACHDDPERTAGHDPHHGTNLAWGVGQHACPAQARSITYLLAEEAVDQLLDALPDLRPEFGPGEPAWRPGPFRRALTALRVTFPPTPSMAVL